MNNIREEIAKNLLFYRKKNGLTQKSLAEKLGVKNTAISNWEKGTNSIDIDTLHKACLEFDVTLDDMCGRFPILGKNAVSELEKSVLKQMSELNTEGQEKVLEYTEGLVAVGRHKKIHSNGMDRKQA